MKFERKTTDSAAPTSAEEIIEEGRKVTVSVRVDTECLLFCDDEPTDYELPAAQITKVDLPEGDHVLGFHDKENPAICKMLEVSIPQKKFFMVKDLKKAFEQMRKEAHNDAQSENIETFKEAIGSYLNADDQILEAEELEELETIRQELELDEATARQLIAEARNQVKQQPQTASAGTAENELDASAMQEAIEANDGQTVKSLLTKWKGTIANLKSSNPQYNLLQSMYYMGCAALEPNKLIQEQENAFTDDYWRIYWTYIAYRKNKRKEKAATLLDSLRQFSKYDEDNITLLEAVTALNEDGPEAAATLVENRKAYDQYSSGLEPLTSALFMEIGREKSNPAKAEKCAFVCENILWFDDPEEIAERRAKREAEMKAQQEAEEEQRMREAAEKEMKEAKLKAELEMMKAKQQAELERKKLQQQREEAERIAQEKAALQKAQDEARKHVTYTIAITQVERQMQAMMTLRGTMGWGSADSRTKLAKLPLKLLETTDQKEATTLMNKLSAGGLTVMVTGTNGLGENVPDCLGQKADGKRR